MTTEKFVSSYQQDIQRFRRYAPEDARAHIALQLASEAGELAGWFGKRLYKPVNPDNLIEELGDCMHYLAQLCEEVGLQLDCIPPRFPPEDVTLDRRLLRMTERAAELGRQLITHAPASVIRAGIALQLHDLDKVRQEAEKLTGQVWTWDAIERANVDKLTGDPSKQAAAR